MASAAAEPAVSVRAVMDEDWKAGIAGLLKLPDMDYNKDYRINYKFEDNEAYEDVFTEFSSIVRDLLLKLRNSQQGLEDEDMEKWPEMNKNLKKIWKTEFDPKKWIADFTIDKKMLQYSSGNGKVCPWLTTEQSSMECDNYCQYLTNLLHLSMTFLALAELSFCAHSIFRSVAYIKLSMKVCYKLGTSPFVDSARTVQKIAFKKAGRSYFVTSLYQKVSEENNVFANPPTLPEVYHETLKFYDLSDIEYGDEIPRQPEADLDYHWASGLKKWVEEDDHWYEMFRLNQRDTDASLQMWEVNYALILHWTRLVREAYNIVDNEIHIVSKERENLRDLLQSAGSLAAVAARTLVPDKKLAPLILWYAGKLSFHCHLQMNMDRKKTYQTALDWLQKAWNGNKDGVPNNFLELIRKDYLTIHTINVVDWSVLKSEDHVNLNKRIGELLEDCIDDKGAPSTDNYLALRIVQKHLLKKSTETLEVSKIREECAKAFKDCYRDFKSISLTASLFVAYANMILYRIDALKSEVNVTSIENDLLRVVTAGFYAAVTVISASGLNTSDPHADLKGESFKSVLDKLKEWCKLENYVYAGVFEDRHSLAPEEKKEKEIERDSQMRSITNILLELKVDDEQPFKNFCQRMEERENVQEMMETADDESPQEVPKDVDVKQCTKCMYNTEQKFLETFVCNDYEYAWFTKDFLTDMLPLSNDIVCTIRNIKFIFRDVVQIMESLCEKNALDDAKCKVVGDLKKKVVKAFKDEENNSDKPMEDQASQPSPKTPERPVKEDSSVMPEAEDMLDEVLDKEARVKKEALCLWRVLDAMQLKTLDLDVSIYLQQ